MTWPGGSFSPGASRPSNPAWAGADLFQVLRPPPDTPRPVAPTRPVSAARLTRIVPVNASAGILWSAQRASGSNRDGHSAGDGENFTGDVAGLGRGQEYERWRQFGGLSDAAERRLLAEVLDFLPRHRGRDQRRPDRSGGYGVDPDASRSEGRGQGAGEVGDSCLGRGVVHQLGGRR